MKPALVKLLKISFVGIVLVLLSFLAVQSQPSNPPDPGGPPSGTPLPHNEKAPIDGGLGILLILGGGYAVLMMARRNKRITNPGITNDE